MIWVALRDDLNHGLARDETNNGCVGDYARRRPNRDASVTDHCLRDSYFSLQSIYLTMHFFFAYNDRDRATFIRYLGFSKEDFRSEHMH